MFHPMFLQVVANTVSDTLAKVAQPIAEQAPEQLSLWYLIKEGGILMIPLFICSILAVYFFVERYIAIRKAGNTPADFMLRIKEKMLEGNISGAQSLAKNSEGALPKMIEKEMQIQL